MNRQLIKLSLSATLLSSSVLMADNENWNCEYCPEQPLWEIQLGANIGIVSDENYHFSNYTGTDENLLFLSGSVRNINPDGSYWISNFENIGSDAEQFNSRYEIPDVFGIELDFKSIPVRKFDQLSSAFINPGSTSLRLSDDWSRSDNTADFSDPSLYTQFELGTDWDMLGLNLSYILNTHLNYSFEYNRIEKSGIRESSANQFFQSVFIPMPVDSIIEDYSARIDYINNDWFGSFFVKFSKFDNNIDAILFANPYTSLVSGANATMLADDPDNTAINASFNLRYSYMPRSYIKAHYSYGLLKQDEQFLPYTTNQSLLTTLPQSSLDGEVETQNLSIKLSHWFNKKLSLRAKYKFYDRYNKTDLQLYRPIVSDMFTAEAIINIPYDLTRESGNIDVDWRFVDKHILSLGIRNKKMERTFQTIRETSEDTVTAKYRAYISNEIQFHINAERSSRSGSAAELIDLISVTENPLLQRFNVSDREHSKLKMQVNFAPVDKPFTAIFSTHYAEDDYEETEIGLQYSWQNNVNLDFTWQVMEDVDLGLFIDRELRETTLGGSAGFNGRDWLVDNIDEIVSYGLNASITELFDKPLTVRASLQFSVADTEIAINNAGYNSELPTTESLWTVVELKADYQYSEKINFGFALVYQDYESHDFSIDDVVPGAAANLLTFDAMSNDYNISYVQMSAHYLF